MNDGRKPTALLAVAGMVLGASPALADKLGLQLYSLRHQLADDLPAALAQVSDWGLDYVEGGGAMYGLFHRRFPR